MNLDKYLKDKQMLVNGFLKGYIAQGKNGSCPRRLHKSMAYSLTAGGKRLRPILAIAGYEAAGGRAKNILPVASALELIHTYSLIHDDLPAMDNDALRRNKPTNHIVFGEAAAILAGDALLTDAFGMIAGANAKSEVLADIIKEVSYACGPQGMVGGQMVDIMLEGKKAKKSEIVYIHTHKTGAFIRASVRVGAIMAGTAKNKLQALTTYGENIGLAFQIVDDILDITGTDRELGKTAGADISRGKNTYPTVFGIDKSRKKAESLIENSIEALRGFDKKAEPLREIARYIISRRS
ncbi:MAG: polyprenyl synthetase family protein [Nitrospirae bacterium]|nr:polyprenyl synthetase family protein [Nitrospirota bacterium]